MQAGTPNGVGVPAFLHVQVCFKLFNIPSTSCKTLQTRRWLLYTFTKEIRLGAKT